MNPLDSKHETKHELDRYDPELELRLYALGFSPENVQYYSKEARNMDIGSSIRVLCPGWRNSDYFSTAEIK